MRFRRLRAAMFSHAVTNTSAEPSRVSSAHWLGAPKATARRPAAMRVKPRSWKASVGLIVTMSVLLPCAVGV